MSRLIDCHIHMYAPEAIADPRAWGEARGEHGWVACVAPRVRRSVQGWATVDRLLADMDAAGVEKCVMLGWYWENQATCEEQNGWYARWVREHSDRLLAFAAAQPRAGQRAIDHLCACLDVGFRGIGEILPQTQHFALSDPCWESVMELAIERRVPVNLHVTDALAVPAWAAPATPLEDYVALARRFPEATLILAHWGGGLPFHELNPRVRDALRNVYYDTAASPLSYDARIFRTVVDLVGADRVLFGSDYPLLLHPREEREPSFARFLEAVSGSGLGADELSRVLGDNFARLVGMD